MNNNILFLILIAIEIALFFMGKKYSYSIGTVRDYLFAPRSLSTIQVVAGLLATQIGCGVILETAQQAYYVGFFGMIYIAGISCGLFLHAFFFTKKIRALPVTTITEIFSLCYDSKRLQLLASLIALIALAGIMCSQIVASRILFNHYFSHSTIFFCLLWLVALAHAALCGLARIAYIGMLDLAIIFSTLGFVMILLIYYSGPGLLETITLQPYFSYPFDFQTALALFILPAINTLIGQDMTQWIVAARTTRTAQRGLFWSGSILFFVGTIPTILGMHAQYLQIELPVAFNPLIPVLQHSLGYGIHIIVFIAIIRALVSTVYSMLYAFSSHLIIDLTLQSPIYMNPLRSAQFVTFFSGVFLVFFSILYFENSMELLVGGYEIAVSCLAIPIIAAYYSVHITNHAGWGGLCGGIFGMILLYSNVWLGAPKLIPLLCSAFGFYAGRVFTFLQRNFFSAIKMRR